jgi:hypothetical protein
LSVIAAPPAGAPADGGDAEAGQENPLVGWPAYPRCKISLSGGGGTESDNRRLAFLRERKNVLGPQRQSGAFLGCITVSVINRFETGHRVVENTLGNLETNAKFRQTRPQRAAQIMQTHVE